MIKSKLQNKDLSIINSLSRKFIILIVSISTIISLAGHTFGSDIIEGWELNDDVGANWGYTTQNGNLLGHAGFGFWNVGQGYIDNWYYFRWAIDGFSHLTVSSGPPGDLSRWIYSYDTNNNLLTFEHYSYSGIGVGEIIWFDIYFDPTDKVLEFTDLYYSGSIMEGTLPNILTVKDAPIIPEPLSSILFLIGGASLTVRQLWKRKKLFP